MSSLVDRLERMTVTVSSPDGNIKARTDFERNATFFLRDDNTIGDYDADTLARHIAAVLRALDEGRRRGIRRAYESQGRTFDNADKPHWDARRRRYRAALAEREIRGRSRRGLIRVKTSGRLDDYRVKVAPEAVGKLDAEVFLGELHSAYRSLLTDRRRQRSALIREHLPR